MYVRPLGISDLSQFFFALWSYVVKNLGHLVKLVNSIRNSIHFLAARYLFKNFDFDILILDAKM